MPYFPNSGRLPQSVFHLPIFAFFVTSGLESQHGDGLKQAPRDTSDTLCEKCI